MQSHVGIEAKSSASRFNNHLSAIFHHLRHRPSLLVGLAVALVAGGFIRTRTDILVSWVLGVVAYGLAFLSIMTVTTIDKLPRVAALTDEGRWGVLVITIVASLASLGAIVAELAQAHGRAHSGWIEALAVAPSCCLGSSSTRFSQRITRMDLAGNEWAHVPRERRTELLRVFPFLLLCSCSEPGERCVDAI